MNNILIGLIFGISLALSLRGGIVMILNSKKIKDDVKRKFYENISKLEEFVIKLDKAEDDLRMLETRFEKAEKIAKENRQYVLAIDLEIKTLEKLIEKTQKDNS